MADPTQPGYEFTMHLRVTLGAPIEVGDTPRGRHRIIPITGGAVAGPKVSGTIVPGGADWQYIAQNGTTEVDAKYTLDLGGTKVGVTSRGVRRGPKAVLDRIARGERVNPTEYYFRTAMRFEAPAGNLAWLSESIFVAKAERLASEVLIEVWRVL